jgi:hypothetical protein
MLPDYRATFGAYSTNGTFQGFAFLYVAADGSRHAGRLTFINLEFEHEWYFVRQTHAGESEPAQRLSEEQLARICVHDAYLSLDDSRGAAGLRRFWPTGAIVAPPGWDSKVFAKAGLPLYRNFMELLKAGENPDISVYEGGLDANWNERKHLVDREFELRMKIQARLVHADPSFEQVRDEERACKAALRRNDEEYESLISRWAAELFPAGA